MAIASQVRARRFAHSLVARAISQKQRNQAHGRASSPGLAASQGWEQPNVLRMDVTLAALHVVEDPIHIPSRHLYLLDGKIWHDLHFVHAELSAKGGLKKDRKTWLVDCKACWEQLDEAPVMLKTQAERLKRDIRSVCNTVGLFSVLVAAIDKSRTATLAASAERYIRQACILPHDPTFLIAGAELSHGMVIGLQQAVKDEAGFAVEHGWQQSWESMRSSGTVTRPWSEAALPLVDVCTFAFFSRSYRRSRNQKKIGQRADRFLTDLGARLVALLAKAVDFYLLTQHVPLHEARAPLVIASGKHRRKYRQALPLTVWEALESAKQGGCSLMTVIRTKNIGVCANQAYTWMRKSHGIYAERRQMSFDGTSHLNIVADPANHSRRSTMVGIAWSWEQAAGALCDTQQMPACSTLYEDELGAAASHLREIRLERISTYRCHIALLSDKLNQSVHRPGKGCMA